MVAGSTASLGSNAVTLSGGTLRLVPSNGAYTYSGFGGTSTSVAGAGTGWTVNNTAITSNPINSNVLTVTDGNINEARTAWLNTPVLVQNGSNGFVATFDYTEAAGGSPLPADGMAFVLQDTGTAALGTAGGGLGYGGILKSVSAQLNIYPNNNPGAAATPAGGASIQNNGTIATAANSTPGQ